MSSWIQKLELSARRSKAMATTHGHAFIFQPNAAQWLERGVLQVTLPHSKDIQDNIGRIFPAAEWIQEDQIGVETVTFNLYGENAKSYIAEYNKHCPNHTIEPWKNLAALKYAESKVPGDLYMLASSAVRKNGTPVITPRKLADSTEILSFKVNDGYGVPAAIDRLKIVFPKDVQSSQEPTARGQHQVRLSGKPATLFAPQQNAFMETLGYKGPTPHQPSQARA